MSVKDNGKRHEERRKRGKQANRCARSGFNVILNHQGVGKRKERNAGKRREHQRGGRIDAFKKKAARQEYGERREGGGQKFHRRPSPHEKKHRDEFEKNREKQKIDDDFYRVHDRAFIRRLVI
ncbi:MAG: hypothetical protein EHM32_06955 [Spirochaetales bacterium]|nr:MAG: hypothetical protein EHM32_06955 [Spirochaetales bacterium]